MLYEKREIKYRFSGESVFNIKPSKKNEFTNCIPPQNWPPGPKLSAIFHSCGTRTSSFKHATQFLSRSRFCFNNAGQVVQTDEFTVEPLKKSQRLTSNLAYGRILRGEFHPGQFQLLAIESFGVAIAGKSDKIISVIPQEIIIGVDIDFFLFGDTGCWGNLLSIFYEN